MTLLRLISSVKSVCSLNRRREFKELLRRVAPTKQDSLLDIGSGDGYWTDQFARYAGRTVGLEPDPHALNSARSLHDRRITFQQGFAEKLPFADNSFDCIVSVSCFEHFRDAQLALDECFRVLAPGSENFFFATRFAGFPRSQLCIQWCSILTAANRICPVKSWLPRRASLQFQIRNRSRDVQAALLKRFRLCHTRILFRQTNH
jgi:ubiquinone/menaquinone biosynthesis C-methylase UbiE